MGFNRIVVLAAAAGLCAACSGALSDGVVDYDQARYPEALRRFRAAAPEAATWDRRDRARYALYRGLTHLALGDRRAASRWLREANAAWNGDRSIFSQEERCQLAAAWAHLPP